MIRSLILALGATFMFAGAAWADPIEGQYQMPSGYHAKIAPCGGGFCITYTNGPFSGKTFGTFKSTGNGTYAGQITDYTDGEKKYKGKAKISGKDVVVSGCVLGGLICRDQSFKRL